MHFSSLKIMFPAPVISSSFELSNSARQAHLDCRKREVSSADYFRKTTITASSRSIPVFRLQLTLSCQMDLNKYPLDTQTCHIELATCEYRSQFHCDQMQSFRFLFCRVSQISQRARLRPAITSAYDESWCLPHFEYAARFPVPTLQYFMCHVFFLIEWFKHHENVQKSFRFVDFLFLDSERIIGFFRYFGGIMKITESDVKGEDNCIKLKWKWLSDPSSWFWSEYAFKNKDVMNPCTSHSTVLWSRNRITMHSSASWRILFKTHSCGIGLGAFHAVNALDFITILKFLRDCVLSF